MRHSIRRARPMLTLGGVLFGSLLGGVGSAAGQGLPGEPTEAEVDAALAGHHENVLDRGLAEGLTVWFIVNAERTILETGVGETTGLEERLRSRYPDITTDFVIELLFMTVNGRRIPILWMLSEPPA